VKKVHTGASMAGRHLKRRQFVDRNGIRVAAVCHVQNRRQCPRTSSEFTHVASGNRIVCAFRSVASHLPTKPH